jgi:HlyD family secretion protein
MKYADKKIIIFVFSLCLVGCDDTDSRIYTGYSHGDFIYLSSRETERIDAILVKKGERVKAGQALVQMEKFALENVFRRAEQNYQAEVALLQNLQSGSRTQELDVIRSQIERASASVDQARRQLKRYRQLYSTHAISAAEWEKAGDDYAQENARLKELTNQLKANQLPARQAEIDSQASRVESAKLQSEKARWDMQQNTLSAPQDAHVYDVLYRRGERPQAGNPILSLLPDGNIKIRFFVPESQLGALQLGMKVRLRCDSCSEENWGVVNYINPEAEYTPPVIYSTKRREKLLFMVEAVPTGEKASLIKIGLPFGVEIVPDV